MRVLSTFNGMGCIWLALDKLGVHVSKRYSSEIDKYATIVNDANYPDTIQLGDVTKVKAQDLEGVDLLVGGSPCQGFSFAGKQLNFDDPRSKLFFEFVRLLNEAREINPEVLFLLENVKMKKEYQQVITDALGVEPVEINSALVSAQNRKRLYWTNISSVAQPEDKNVRLKDILEANLDDPTYMSDRFVERNKEQGCLREDFTGKAKNLLAMEYVKNGRQGDYLRCASITGRRLNEKGVRDDYNKNVPITQCLQVKLDSSKTGRLTTVQKDNAVTTLPPGRYPDVYKPPAQIREKSKCVRSSGRGSYDRHEWDSVDNGHYRKLTPLECERLQTVPDKYTNHVSNSQRYRMLGNGWTVDVIAHILEPLALIW